jgi:hypothetical protein
MGMEEIAKNEMRGATRLIIVPSGERYEKTVRGHITCDTTYPAKPYSRFHLLQEKFKRV